MTTIIRNFSWGQWKRHFQITSCEPASEGFAIVQVQEKDGADDFMRDDKGFIRFFHTLADARAAIQEIADRGFKAEFKLFHQ